MIIDIKKLELPKELTASEWNKNKGIIAKMAGETGLGAALASLAKHQDEVVSKLKIPGFPADEKVALGTKLQDWTHNANEKSKAFMVLVKALSDAADTVETTAQNAAAKFAKSKTIPKSSTDYAKSVMDEAKAYKKIVDSITLNSVTAIAAGETKRITDEIADMNKLVFKGQWEALKLATAKIEKAKIGDFINGATEADKTWDSLIFQPTRASLAALSKLSTSDPAIKKVYEEYAPKLHNGSDDMGWPKIGGKDETVKKVLAVVEQMASENKKLLAKFG